MNRREFIKKSLQLGVALSAASQLPALDLVGIVRAETKPDPTVSVATGKQYKNIVIDAVDKLGGMKKFISSGDVVVVKPNIAWDSTPELGANTHPTVVKTVVELCLDAGAKQVKVFDRTANESRRAYKRSGVQDAVNEIKDDRVDMKFVDNHKFIQVNIKKESG